ncbi:hypothetical protein MARBORIA2_13230 [Methanobrevibacter arboriphilus]|jgi:hypothetical protein|uniref:Uncharacterized protein n=1 Tax=Methanobrevibacter arboriphilus TaxID=39441 RepID=A0ACA8R1M6_METAZ|nr:hypothetical protein MarbSA_02120 [Methanobrevibacter arboriphilus]GLI12233.1 hypothetical protein MARBORIA2_13230 [Methanobrevibacter arboriphilus]
MMFLYKEHFKLLLIIILLLRISLLVLIFNREYSLFNKNMLKTNINNYLILRVIVANINKNRKYLIILNKLTEEKTLN